MTKNPYSLLYVCVIILTISYLAYSIADLLGFRAPTPLINENKCSFHSGIIGAEDIVNYNGIPIISSDDRAKLFFRSDYGINKTENGKIYTVIPKKTGDKIELINQSIMILGFPSDILFHPHGIAVFKDKLFVINHAFYKGGERVEVFNIETNENELILIYNNSILFGEKYSSMFNDLTVISETEILITTSSDIPYESSVFNVLERFLRNALLHKTYVYYVEINLHNPVEKTLISMTKQTETADRFNNGIAYDGEIILVGNSLDKRVSLYTFEKNNGLNEKLKFKRIISVGNELVDNINYDERTQSFFLGVGGRVYDFLLEIDMLSKNGRTESQENMRSGAYLIKKTGDLKLMEAEVLFNQYVLTGVSVACKFDDYILLGAPYANGISYCLL